MASEPELEKSFSQIVDRLLAGETVNIDPETEKDLGKELDFARRMIALRQSPDPQFQADLKARLLQKLAEQDVKAHAPEKPGFWRRLWPQARAWQVAMAVLAILIIGGIVWRTGTLRSTAPPPPPGTLLTVDASTNKAKYRPGEEVRIDVVMTNVSPRPLKIEQFPPILSLMRADTRQPVYTFSAGQSARTLAPGEDAEFTLSWNQLDRWNRPAPGGGYYIELENLDLQGQSTQLNLRQPVRFDILAGTSLMPQSPSPAAAGEGQGEGIHTPRTDTQVRPYGTVRAWHAMPPTPATARVAATREAASAPVTASRWFARSQGAGARPAPTEIRVILLAALRTLG